jgi:hypothetical protein
VCACELKHVIREHFPLLYVVTNIFLVYFMLVRKIEATKHRKDLPMDPLFHCGPQFCKILF